MICRDCPEGRRYAKETVYCIQYGMIIREDYECLPERRKKHEPGGGGAADLRGGREKETGLHDHGSSAAGEMPGVLSGSGE